MAGLSFGSRTIVASCFLGSVAGQWWWPFSNTDSTTAAPPLTAVYNPEAGGMGYHPPVYNPAAGGMGYHPKQPNPTYAPVYSPTTLASGYNPGAGGYNPGGGGAGSSGYNPGAGGDNPTYAPVYSPTTLASGYNPGAGGYNPGGGGAGASGYNPGAGGYNPGAGGYNPGTGHRIDLQPGSVDCGGHIERSCGDCPQGNGESWCNGQCVWVGAPTQNSDELGVCLPKVPLPGMAPELSPLGASFYYWIAFFVATLLVQMVFAFVFYVRVVSPSDGWVLPQVNDITVAPVRRHIFDCFKHRDTCVHATFALPLVAAKNVHIAGVMPYWVGFFIMAFAICGPFALWGYWPGFVGCAALVALVRVVISVQVQKNLGFAPNIIKTCVYNIFCLPCDIGRESLEADQEVGAEFKGCFNMECDFAVEAAMDNLVDRTCAAERNCLARTCAGSGNS